MKNFPIQHEGKEYWVSRSVAAVSYVYTIKDGEVLVLANKRGIGMPNNVGRWNAPSGFLDYGETIKGCAIRETYEETGVVIKDTMMKELDDNPDRPSQNILVRFACYAPYQEPNADHCEPNEVEEVRWIPLSKVDEYEWTSERHLQRLKEYGNHYERLLGVWQKYSHMAPFGKDVGMVPFIPCVEDDAFYEDVIVRNIIRCGGIPKDKLEVGAWYRGECRNAKLAQWKGEGFVYERTKFGYTYNEEINHFQDDDGYDVFVPIEKVER